MNARFVPPVCRELVVAQQPQIAALGNVILLGDGAVAPDHRCDILSISGRKLWQAISLADVPRLITMNRADPEHYPDWQGELTVAPWAPAPLPRSSSKRKPRGYADGLPLATCDGITPMLNFVGTDVGLGNDTESISVACGGWSAEIDIELALFHLDDFTDEGRKRLTALLGWYFGVQLSRGAA